MGEFIFQVIIEFFGNLLFGALSRIFPHKEKGTKESVKDGLKIIIVLVIAVVAAFVALIFVVGNRPR